VPETVAVQVLNDRVLLARATDGAGGAELAELVTRELAEGDDALQVAAQMIRDRHIENIGLSITVDWDQYSMRNIWLPFTSDAQIQSTIKHELEDDFSADADELLMPFQLLETRPDSGHVLAWVAHKETIGSRLSDWDSLGISPEYMPPDVMGHVGLVASLAPELASQPVVAISGDERSVHLTLLVGDTIWARRRLLDYAWATDAAGRPLQEIRRTFLSVPSFPEPAAVVTFGGEPADTLGSVVARDLGCEHRVVAPPALPDGERILQWPLVAGIALLTARGSDRPLSFRREEFEPKETAQVVSLLSVVATALLGVIFLVGGVWCHLLAQNETRESRQVAQNVRTYWTSVFKDTKKNPVPAVSQLTSDLGRRITKMRKDLKGFQSRSDAIKRFTQLVNRLGNTPESVQLQFSRISVRTDNTTFLGTANSYDAVTALNKHIAASPDLAAELAEITPLEGGRARFRIEITYRNATKVAKP
jgi:hypothetical protein